MINDKFNLEQTQKLDEANEFAKRIEAYNKGKSKEDTDRTIFALTYLSTENLVKYSKTLRIWTIVIGVSTILLFISAVLQLVKLFFFSQ